MITQSIATTPMAPYEGIMRTMSRSQKLVVMAFLIDTLNEDESENQQTVDFLKPHPFMHFKSKEDMTDDDKAFLASKIKSVKVSPRVDKFVNGLSLTADEMQDERTKYMLGLEQ